VERFPYSIFILLILLASIAALPAAIAPNTTGNGNGNAQDGCDYYYWFDDSTQECGYKEFCGTFMYYGLQTFPTLKECEEALSEQTPTPTPSPTPTITQITPQPTPLECTYYYWFDNESTECGYKEFCGAFMYYGLQTFRTKKECQTALAAARNCVDSDGGKNYYVKGTATGYENGQIVTSTDGCRNDNKTLAEVYCEDEYLRTAQYECPAGCKDGACIKSECAAGGEHYSKVFTDEYPSECCSGLTEFEAGMDTRISIADKCYETGLVSGWPVGICINCGNGKCEGIESVCSCPEDCVGQGRSTFNTLEEFCAEGVQKYPVLEYLCEGVTPEKCCKPTCRNIGTRSEGWYSCKGGLIRWENCEGCEAKCDKIGTESEGWYDSCTGELIAWDNCSACEEPSECPAIAAVYPYCPNGEVEPVYREINGQNCLVGYECVEPPVYVGPVFIHTEENGFGGYSKTFRLHNNGEMTETMEYRYSNQSRKMKGRITQEQVAEFMDSLDSAGFFEIEKLDDCSYTGSCPTDLSIYTAYANWNSKENKVRWQMLNTEHEAITLVQKYMAEFEQMLESADTTIYVNLGEQFKIKEKQTAVTRETGLHLEVVKAGDSKIAVEIWADYGVATSSSAVTEGTVVYTSLEPGETAKAFGHEIALHEIVMTRCGEYEGTRCIGSEPIAVMSISKEEPYTPVNAYLGYNFTLKVQQSAILLSGKPNTEEVKSRLLKVTLNSIIGAACQYTEKEESTENIIYCDKRNIAKLSVENLEQEPCPKGQYCSNAGAEVSLRQGEKRQVFGYTIHALRVADERASFMIKKPDGGEIIVELGEEFPLKETQTALVKEKDLYIYLEQLPFTAGTTGSESAKATIRIWRTMPVLKPMEVTKQEKATETKAVSNAYTGNVSMVSSAMAGGAQGGVSTATQQIAVAEETLPAYYRQTYELSVGESISIYEVKITFTKYGGEMAYFIVEEEEPDVKNVHVDEPFKLLEGQGARVLEANMRIDLLNIIEQISIPSQPEENGQGTESEYHREARISVTNFFLSQAQTGQVSAEEVLKEAVSQQIIQKTTAQNAVSATTTAQKAISTATNAGALVKKVEPIEMPPTPYRVFTLAEGESVTMGDFSIKANYIGFDSAEFIVTKKHSGELVKFTMYSGWSLISFPGELEVVESTPCETEKFSLLEYDAFEKKYKRVTNPEMGKAYWLYNGGEECHASAYIRNPVAIESLPMLAEGWNFVPVLEGMLGKTISEMGCNLLAAYMYDAEKQEWIEASGKILSAEDYGKAIAVKTAGECFLGAGGEMPPALPE